MPFLQLVPGVGESSGFSPTRALGSYAPVLRGALLAFLVGLGIGFAACTRSSIPPPAEPQTERHAAQTVVAVDGGPVHEKPTVLNSVAPDYPKLARLEKRSGEVLLRVRIDEEGAVRWILLEKSDRRFDGAAVQAVREWRFTPALRDGEPVAVDVLIPMRFRSDG